MGHRGQRTGLIPEPIQEAERETMWTESGLVDSKLNLVLTSPAALGSEALTWIPSPLVSGSLWTVMARPSS